MFSKISSLINEDPILSDSEKEKAISLSVDELNSINHNARNQLFTVPMPEKEKTIDESVHKILNQVSHGIKCRKEQSDGSSGEESDDTNEPPHKKCKVKESDIGWFDPDNPSLDCDDIACQETCRLLQTYNKDISGAKFLIRTSRRAPEGIPSSQWERILRGEILDLNHFLSSLHCTTITEEGETCIGNTKISIGVADAKRHVSTAAKWSSAWHLASRATAFTFPHRSKNYASMGTLLAPNSQQNCQVLTPESSSSILPSEMLCKEDINTSLLIVPFTSISIQQSLCPMESKQVLPSALIGDQPNCVPVGAKQTLVTNSTLPTDVLLQMQIVNTATSARNAKKEDMERNNARTRSYQDLLGTRPKYL